MRIASVIQLAGAAVLAAVAVQAGSARPSPAPKPAVSSPSSLSTPTMSNPSIDSPALRVKRAEARRVLAEIAAIDEKLTVVSEEFDGARLRLDALRNRVTVGRQALKHARARYEAAQKRAAKLLVWLYTTNRRSSVDVILGATSLTEMIGLSDAEDAISTQTVKIESETAAAKRTLTTQIVKLVADRKAAEGVVIEIARVRGQILHGLEQRTKLLAKVSTEVVKLEALERARQARLAERARARLAAASSRAALSAKRATSPTAAPTTTVQAQAPAPVTTTEAVPTTPAASTTAATTTTTTAAATGEQAGAQATTVPVGAGHPEVATLALQFLGVPYVWGGATPSGFDCSGLISYVYAKIGINLPHFAASQWTFGVPVATADLAPGDLVFFHGLNHVGIYLGDNQFVAAPHTGSYVKIDSLSEAWYATHYVGAKRI